MYNKKIFRELTIKIIAAEKEGFWSDYTDFEKKEYLSKDWERFSRARGYSEEEIKEFREWIEMFKESPSPFDDIRDLTTEAYLKNKAKDNNNEILKTSHLFFLNLLNKESV